MSDSIHKHAINYSMQLTTALNQLFLFDKHIIKQNIPWNNNPENHMLIVYISTLLISQKLTGNIPKLCKATKSHRWES